MKIQFLGSRAQHRLVVRALPVLVGVLGVFVVAIVLSHVRGKQADPVAPGARRPQGLAGYVQSDRWRADVRTAGEMLRYLLEREPEDAPNVPPPVLQLAMPTNSAEAPPKG